MSDNSRGSIFRKRNVLGAALAAGIGLGLYLGKYGVFGLGAGLGLSGGGSSTVQVSGEGDDRSTKTDKGKSDDSGPRLELASINETIPDVIRVMIDDRQYLLRAAKGTGGDDVPVTLKNLIELIKQAPGDKDGVRVRIYEKPTARMKEEETLKDALRDAGIDETAVLWISPPVK